MKAAAAIACVALAGCSLAPDYSRPALPVPEAYKEAGDWLSANPQTVERGAWWQAFGDEQLNALEDQVTSANQSLKAALARFEQARGAAAVARAGLFPVVTATASGTRQRVSGTVVDSRSGTVFNDYLLGADVSYEIDVWGRVRNAVASGEALASASAGDLAAMDLSLHAELAMDYFSLRGDDASQTVLEEAAAAYQKALELTQARHEGGAAAEADVDQAQAQLETAKTQAADMRLRRAQLEHAIAVLTGQPPSALTLAPSPLAAAPPPLSPGLPSTLLERRPDIAAAERRAAAANAEIGVARAAYFPDFTLGASGGVESAMTAALLHAPSLFWSLGPSAALTLVDGGRISALSDEARAAYEEAAANYRQTVLSAYQEVEDSLAAMRELERESATQAAATAAAQRALAQAKNRYTAGVATYLDIVVEQNMALQAELSEVDINTRRVNASVQLIKALGGGWQESDLATPAPEKKEEPANGWWQWVKEHT